MNRTGKPEPSRFSYIAALCSPSSVIFFAISCKSVTTRLMGFTLFLTCTAPTPDSDRLARARNRKCRPSNHDCAVSTYHCFVCSDKKPEPEVAQRTEQGVAQRGPQTLTAHSSHHCPRLRENATNTDRTQFSPLSSTPRKYHEKQQKTTIWYPKIIKNVKKHGKNVKLMFKIRINTTKHGKNDNLMSKNDQQRVLCFRNL